MHNSCEGSIGKVFSIPPPPPHNTFTKYSSYKKRHKFKQKCLSVPVPHRKTFYRDMKRFQTADAILDLRECAVDVLTEERLDRIGTRLEIFPRKFLHTDAHVGIISMNCKKTAAF
jgi:hypothetical protein